MSTDDAGPIRRLISATRCSLRGLREGWRTQAALRYELWVLAVAVPVGFFLGNGGVERVLLIGSCLLVVVVELVNSAIESAVDRIGREHHELSGRGKDLGSAAVFCSIALAAAVWLLILILP